eukprot:2325067-Alexandrium_andersonii.AAC.1
MPRTMPHGRSSWPTSLRASPPGRGPPPTLNADRSCLSSASSMTPLRAAATSASAASSASLSPA